MVSVSVLYLFYQPKDGKIKTWTLRFPAKENPNMEKALFDWPIVLQYDVKAKYRLISREFFEHEVFSAERSLNQPKATHVCIHLINQSNRSISVRLLFLFFSGIIFSRSYENRSNCNHLSRTSQGSHLIFKDHMSGMSFHRLYTLLVHSNRTLRLELFALPILYILQFTCLILMVNYCIKQNRFM